MTTDELSSSDLRVLLLSAHELQTAADSTLLAERVQALLQQLIGADVVVWNELTRGGRVCTGMTFPDLGHAFWREVAPGMFAHMHEHPFVRHLLHHPQPTFAAAISDFMATRTFVESGLYREGYDVFRARHQISAAVRHPNGDYLVVSLNRHSSDFTVRDKVVLEWVARQASVAFLNLRRCEQLANRLALQSLRPSHRDATWLYCNGDDMITWGAPDLDRFLRDHFSHETTDLFLPAVLRPSFHAQLRAWQRAEPRPDRAVASRRLTVGRREFYLHFERRGGSHRIILAAEPNRHRVPALPSGDNGRLTPRQLEVAHWVAQGKTNAEIGLILGISARTAEKHVHAALAKFGVETRLQLARVLDELATAERAGPFAAASARR